LICSIGITRTDLEQVRVRLGLGLGLGLLKRKELKKARGVKVGALVEDNQVKGADNADTHMDTT
jgi:hypothetical protein